jgi:1-pyrroline-5-carboxylate dehydrogenase
MTFRITYSVLDADMSEVHALFDTALASAREKAGIEVPSWVNGEARWGGAPIESRNPADTRQLLATAHSASLADVDAAVAAARVAQRQWAATTWQHKVATLRRAADLISERRAELAAIMALEVGKNRLESLGDVEESADLLRYYAGQLEEAQGFVKPLTKLSPNEDVRSVLRPWGVFVVIAPFNFPTALAAGMSSGALLGGNAVILKPSEDAPWCADGLYHAMIDAGVPAGLFQVLHGTGETIGDALVKHPGIDGVVFTGSFAVGHAIYRYMTSDVVRPCFLEMGGKNAAIIAEDADLNTAIEGCWRSAFGLSGQKCSALSRVYVHSSLKDAFIAGLKAKADALVVGDPTDRNVYMGPVINAASVARFEKAAAAAAADGTIHAGGAVLRDHNLAHGFFVAPTIVEVPHDHWIERDELFLPFVCVSAFDDLDDAMARVNNNRYGLTGGFYSADDAKVDWYLDHVEAGCVYTNRAAGATTGAWPGVQAFCGWKGSGSSGKGGCGPYYVAQFMREQSRTRVQ